MNRKENRKVLHVKSVQYFNGPGNNNNNNALLYIIIKILFINFKINTKVQVNTLDQVALVM
jgi:hypothetical protein